LRTKLVAHAAVAALIAMAGCSNPSPTVATAASGEKAADTTTRASATPVPPPQLHALYSERHREDGVVLSGDNAGKKWIKWAAPDGSMRLSAAHGLYRDAGHFKIEGDKVCSTWEHIDEGKTACMHLVEVAPDTYVSVDHDGKQSSRFKVTTPGAPPDPLD
jgi:hypothetical protein